MNAKEARTIALNTTSDKDKGQIKEIEANITKAVHNGELEAFYYKAIRPNVKNHFEKLGYAVYCTTARNETTVTIKW